MSTTQMLRKHLGLTLAGVSGFIGACLLFLAWYSASDPAVGFAENLLLNLGTEVIGIALTVGLVDVLLQRRAERDFTEAATPRISELRAVFSKVTDIQEKLPARPTKDDLSRYRAALQEAVSACHDLNLLVASRRPQLASELSSFASVTRALVIAVDNLMTDLLNEAMGLSNAFESLRAGGRALDMAAGSVNAVLAKEALLTNTTNSINAIGGRA